VQLRWPYDPHMDFMQEWFKLSKFSWRELHQYRLLKT
jgi:hypothetical protein